MDMASTIEPKSTQLNADDLLCGPRTITITAVRANEGSTEQPVAISFADDNGKPFLPCKSMRRVMVHVWGADAKIYVGRSMTLYCDPKVQWGGMAVGGIRISHMSHIDKPMVMALTASKAKRAPFTVQPLIVSQSVDIVAHLIGCYIDASSTEAWDAIEKTRAAEWKKIPTDDKPRVKAASDAAKARISSTPYSAPDAGL